MYRIVYSQKVNNDIVNLELPRNEISSYQIGFYTIKTDISKKFSSQKFRLDIHSGYGRSTAKIPTEYEGALRKYARKLASGFQWGTNLRYFIKKDIALGLLYNNFLTSRKGPEATLQFVDGTTTNSILNDDIAIHFFGPSISVLNTSSKKNNELSLTFAPGYQKYRNKIRLGVSGSQKNVKITGDTFGLMTALEWNTRLSNDLMFGLDANYIIGQMNTVKVTDSSETETVKLSGDETISLARLNFSLGFIIKL